MCGQIERVRQTFPHFVVVSSNNTLKRITIDLSICSRDIFIVISIVKAFWAQVKMLEHSFNNALTKYIAETLW